MKMAKLADPRWWRFMAQRRVSDIAARNKRADRIAANQPQGAGDRQAGRIVDRDGCLLMPSLPTAKMSAMRDYYAEQDAFDNYRPHLGTFRAPENAPPSTRVANYPEEIVACAPHAMDIANAPDVLAAVTAVLGCKSTIASLSAWWSLPAQTPAEHAELWHRDVDDYRFLKLFVALTEIDETSGPHGFVRGSHRSSKLLQAGRRIPHEEVVEQFGADEIVRYTGPAGTRFLENTYGVHRGYPCTRRSRLIFQVLYAQRPSVYSPIKSIGLGDVHDPWINRLYR